LCLICCTYFSALAQKDKSANITYGVKAGLTFPHLSFLNETTLSTNTSITSFYVGGTISAPIGTLSSGKLSVQSGLSIVGKGGQRDIPPGPTNIKDKLLYLEMPISLVASFQLGTGHIFLGAGPYLSLGLSAKEKRSPVSGLDTTVDVGFGSGELKAFKATDWGFDFLLGYQLKNNFSFNGGYSAGISNINNDAVVRSKNSLFSIGVGYSFR
jgi:hypothetical protein